MIIRAARPELSTCVGNAGGGESTDGDDDAAGNDDQQRW